MSPTPASPASPDQPDATHPSSDQFYAGESHQLSAPVPFNPGLGGGPTPEPVTSPSDMPGTGPNNGPAPGPPAAPLTPPAAYTQDASRMAYPAPFPAPAGSPPANTPVPAPAPAAAPVPTSPPVTPPHNHPIQSAPFGAPTHNHPGAFAGPPPTWHAYSQPTRSTNKIWPLLLIVAGVATSAGGLLGWANIAGYGTRGGSTQHQVLVAAAGLIIAILALAMLGKTSPLLPLAACVTSVGAAALVGYNMIQIVTHLSGRASFGVGVWVVLAATVLAIVAVIGALTSRSAATPGPY